MGSTRSGLSIEVPMLTGDSVPGFSRPTAGAWPRRPIESIIWRKTTLSPFVSSV
ncbi:hypothetical protein [Streptomyces sp. NPDC005374]|uniref:hypothetical protein n=1 Tax=Streptomyces sp. NPDC005374 TaxID=3364713 RepID=UPI0036970B7A